MKTVPKARHTFSLFTLNFSLLTAGKLGTPEGTRTPDLLLRRQLLYPAELLAHVFGAGDGNRTRVSSLEGWCSTIELHPQIHLSGCFSQSILPWITYSVKAFSLKFPEFFYK